MKNNDAIINRLRKVLALAEGGSGGERSNAERQLAAMLKKHGLTMADISDSNEDQMMAIFKCENEFEIKLARQVVGSFANVNSINFWIYKGKPKLRGFDLPKSRALEAMMHFEIYKKALNQTLDRATSAFIRANNIYPKTTRDLDENPLTPEEIAEHEAVRQMARGIGKTSVFKAIDKKD